MSPYHIVFLILLLGVLIEYVIGRTPKILFGISFLILSLMMVFRFGQGTDYYSYSIIFTTMPLDLQGILTYSNMDIELAWRFLCAAFKLLNLSFASMVFVLSVLEMLLLHRFIAKYCKNRMLALFLAYHTLYLTYFFSALRQALVISFFLGVFLDWLLERKYIRYCVCIVLCSLIHPVSLILLLPVLLRVVRLRFNQMIGATVLGCIIGGILSILNVGQWLLGAEIMSSMTEYLGETDISLVAFLERLLSYGFVTYTCYLYFGGREPEEKDRIFFLYKVYSLGILLYGLLMWSPLISSRVVYMFKVLEISLICTGICKCKKAKPVVLLYCIMICSLLYFKNIGSYISQGYYFDVNVMQYPYVSIFDRERIAEYRKDTGFAIEWLELEFDEAYVNQLKEDYWTLAQ